LLIVMLLKLENLWNFNQINSDSTAHNESPKYDIQYAVQYSYSTVQFLISSSSYVCNTRSAWKADS